MKKILPVSFAIIIFISILSGCSISDVIEPTWPPKIWNQKDYGSFSPDITFSYDEKYYAVQTLSKPEGKNVNYINVTIYENGTNILIDSFLTERAFDFWGVCWEDDTYNLWIQSADIGTYCMRHEEGKWIRVDDPSLQMPKGMIDRSRMRQGSFLYVSAYSNDNCYVADRSLLEGCLVIRNVPTNEIVFRYPIDQIDDFRGVCWDNNNNLWLRSGNAALALRYDGETWIYDNSLTRPDEVVFAYKWDGTVE